MDKAYIAIDLKSFYASVECSERGIDPLDTCLVVADPTRTEKTICLAVSPALKSYGIPGRPRLFEVVQKVKEINNDRRRTAPGRRLTGSSVSLVSQNANPSLEVDYITAPPRMKLYMKYSTKIYDIYLKYFSPDDIHVYSCDEVFIDATPYLGIYDMTPHELTRTIISDVLVSTGITATAGIGTNLYLCKIAMDIMAKKIPPDKDGVRIVELDEKSYREQLWVHTPITDFWGVGSGIAKRLAGLHLFTMGDIAAYSEMFEDSLYNAFGVKAELLIDHAWGWEPCTIWDIKHYEPKSSSLSSGQVLQRPYSYSETEIIVREMADRLALDLVKKGLVTDQLTLTVNFECFRSDEEIRRFNGEMHYDWYGRPAPKHAHGTANLAVKTSVSSEIINAFLDLYRRIVDKELFSRRITVCACNVTPCAEADAEPEYEQLDLFTDYEAREKEKKEERLRLKKEAALQQAQIEIKDRFGNNAILKGTNFLKGATARERNAQVGGHKA